MIFEDKAPYLLTILFAALGWAVAQVSSDLRSSPLVEYEITEKTVDNTHTNVVTIRNISLGKSFTNLLFKLRLEKISGAKCIGNIKINPQPPTELKNPSSVKGAPKPECSDGVYAEYSISKLHPGSTIQLLMNTNKKTDLSVYVWSDTPIKLLKKSFYTCIAKNRFGILISLIVVWSILIAVYIIVLGRNKPLKPSAPGETS